MDTDNISMREMGFLGAFPGREFRVSGHDLENTSGLLVLQVVAIRATSDDAVIEAANAQGLRLEASFDDAHPDFVLLETIGMVSPIEHMAKALAARGFHRLEPQIATHHAEDVPPRVDFDDLPDPMTDEDAARFLRRRDAHSVQRMRLHGGLRFTPGRPPLISKADLLDYVEKIKVQVTPKSKAAAEPRTKGQDEMVQDARQYALKMKLRPPRKPRGKSAGH